MARLLESPERRRLQEIAREYEGNGYTVLVSPETSELPGFLKKFHPDMLAISKEESVVVEIKSGSLRGDHELVKLAEAVDRAPGWRLEVIVTGPPKGLGDAQHELLDATAYDRLLHDAALLMHQASYPSAVLVLGIAAEAAARTIARVERISSDHKHAGYVVKQLTVLGCIEREDYNVLQAGLEARDALAHGQRPADLDEDMAKDFARAVRRLVDSLKESRSSASV
jgi:hypothetical protein